MSIVIILMYVANVIETRLIDDCVVDHSIQLESIDLIRIIEIIEDVGDVVYISWLPQLGQRRVSDAYMITGPLEVELQVRVFDRWINLLYYIEIQIWV